MLAGSILFLLSHGSSLTKTGRMEECVNHPLFIFPSFRLVFQTDDLSIFNTGYSIMWPKCHKSLVKGGTNWGTNIYDNIRQEGLRLKYLRGPVEQEDTSNSSQIHLFFMAKLRP